MNDLLQAGIIFFNEGRYYEAHESWEDLWRLSDDDDRRFCQGLVQVAVGLHHLANGNASGGNRVLIRGLGNIEAFPDRHRSIDNASLIRDIYAVLENGGASQIRIHCP